jgi:RecA-family ATPase
MFLEGIERTDGNGEHFDTDVTLGMITEIEQAIKRTAKETKLPVKMVVIDPIANYWGNIQENSNAEVRSVLKPLQMLAEKTGVACIMIQHIGKGDKAHAQQKVLGSTGIVAVCRAVWGVYQDTEDKSLCLFAPVKINCGHNHTAVSYRIMPPDGKVEIIDGNIENLTGDDIESALKA